MSERWTRTFRVESIYEAEPDAAGWVAYDIVLRPMDRIGRVNGRTKNLTTVYVGGPADDVDMTGLRVGVKCVWSYDPGPAPTYRSTLRPVA